MGSNRRPQRQRLATIPRACAQLLRNRAHRENQLFAPCLTTDESLSAKLLNLAVGGGQSCEVTLSSPHLYTPAGLLHDSEPIDAADPSAQSVHRREPRGRIIHVISMAKRKAEEAEVEIDPFFGLDDLPVGDSLLKDDDYHGAESPDAANENDQVEMTNATAPAVIDEITTAEDDASLPPWMRAAHASVIAAKTPSTKDLGLDPRLLTALKKKLGVRRCFPVQAAVIPVVLGAHAGRCAADVCVCAPTGSGKTLAYALPVVQALLPRVVTRLRALVLLPTAASPRRCMTSLPLSSRARPFALVSRCTRRHIL